ncbi:MAG: hypothetical protein GY797_14960 [Deltaproteobacteria bacterium]|nr:hypothetical protein [Deltaproteobacteria bacterium]
MHHITVEVQNHEKAQQLYAVLQALDFVTQISSTDDKQEDFLLREETPGRSEEFFSYAGLWADREISVTTPRKQAWPRQFIH